ncbi:hypothetical protein CDAR_477761 [Caerostris darwini]|uniref:Uncharacterized protein n=1 Tax=Caerostris darwini TaxID=1538125 RepID=A0AAV4ME38_9ARAC|nr:hypothetical protein CDAR_477761 [Caerostris darwini]
MMKKLLSAISGTDRNRGPTAFKSVSVYLTIMKNIIVSHFWYGQEQGPYSFSLCELLSDNDEKIIVSHFCYGKERGPTAFPSVSVYLTMKKIIIVSHFWYGQEQEQYSVSICERLSNNDEKNYCQPLLVRTGTGALQRFHL